MLSAIITNKQKQGSTRKLLEVMNMFITMIVLMVSQVCAFVQTPQIV